MSQSYKLGYRRTDEEIGKIEKIIHMITVNENEKENEKEKVHIFYTEKPGETIRDLKQKMNEVLGLENIFFEAPYDDIDDINDNIVISSDLILTLSPGDKEDKDDKDDKDDKIWVSIVKNTFDHLKICEKKEKKDDAKDEAKEDKRCFIGDIVEDEEYASLVFYNAEGCAMYKKGGQMGHKSAFGVVYHTCCGEEEPCHHITKIVKFRADREIKYEQANFHKEVMLQQKVAKAGLAPSIVTSYMTPTQGIVVMEKMNKTLLDHMNDYLMYAQLHNLSTPEIEKTAEIFAINMGELLIRLHQQGIYHQDAHLNNVMTNRDNRLIFIDFGMAIFDEDDNDKEVNHPDLNVDAKIKFDREYRQIPNITLDYIVDNDPNQNSYIFMKAYIKKLEEFKDYEYKGLIRGEKLQHAPPAYHEAFAEIIKSMNVIPISTLQTEMLPLAEPVPVYFNL